MALLGGRLRGLAGLRRSAHVRGAGSGAVARAAGACRHRCDGQPEGAAPGALKNPATTVVSTLGDDVSLGRPPGPPQTVLAREQSHPPADSRPTTPISGRRSEKARQDSGLARQGTWPEGEHGQ